MLSRSKYYSNAFSTIQGEASSCKVDQEGSGNILNIYKSALGAAPPNSKRMATRGSEAKPEGSMAGSQYTFGKGLGGAARKGGSFGNAALQKADIPATSHARDLKGSGTSCGKGAKKVNVQGGYKYKR